MLELVALILERIKGLIFNFPPRSSSLRNKMYVVFFHFYIRNPSVMVDLIPTGIILPIFDKVDEKIRISVIKGDLVHKFQSVDTVPTLIVNLVLFAFDAFKPSKKCFIAVRFYHRYKPNIKFLA